MGAIFGLRTFMGTFGRRSAHYPGEESDRRLADALHVELKRIFPGPEEGREPASADRKVAQELSRALAARLSFHREGLLSSKARHDRLSFNLAWMIPVGSAIVTSIIALPRYEGAFEVRHRSGGPHASTNAATPQWAEWRKPARGCGLR